MKCIMWVVLSGCCGGALATEGALEISQDCAANGCFAGDTAGFPVQIAAGGSYVLTSDLSVGEFESAVDVSVTGGSITIDLGGHVIDGGGRCTGTPVTACTSVAQVGVDLSDLGAGRALVRNGAIRGFNRAVYAFSHEGMTTLEDLDVSETTENGFAAIDLDGSTPSSVVLRRVTVSRNLSGGMRTGSGIHAVLEDAAVFGNGGAGGLHGATIFGNGTVVRSRFSDNAGISLVCIGVCAAGENVFIGNNGGSANPQFLVSNLLDMGGNVCGDGNCP